MRPEKPEILPLQTVPNPAEILEVALYLTQVGIHLGRSLEVVEINEELMGSRTILLDKQQQTLKNQTGRILSHIMGPVRYKNTAELATKIQQRQSELNLL
jgi:hypothetical protein